MVTAKEKGLPPIPESDLRAMIGKRVHLSWARVGCNWVLKEVIGDIATLETPSTGIKRKAKITDLVYTKRYAGRASK